MGSVPSPRLCASGVARLGEDGSQLCRTAGTTLRDLRLVGEEAADGSVTVES